MDKYVHQTEMTQQSINHVLNYPGEANGVFMSLDKSQQDDVYEILNQILWKRKQISLQMDLKY